MSIAAIIATSTLGACSPDRAEPGSKTYSRTIIKGSRTTVELPTGSLDLVVSKPRDELTDREAKPRSAPDGGSFVGLSWEFRRAEPTLSNAYAVTAAQAAEVVLVSNDKRYPIGKPYDPAHKVGDETRSSSWWVAVDGDADDLEVEVAYDGETQVVDIASGEVKAGRAAPLYDPPAIKPVESPCATAKPSGPFPRPDYDSFTCQAEVVGLVPYVAQGGWADSGRAWAIVSVSNTLFGPLGWSDGTELVEFKDIVPGVWSAEVDGRPGRMIIDHTKGKGGHHNAIIAADVAPDGPAQLVLRTSYRSGAAQPGGTIDHPETVGVSFTRTLRLTY